MQAIKERFERLEGKKKLIITTEKDATRLQHHPALAETLKPYLYILPIEIEFYKINNIYLTKILLAMLELIQETAAYLKGRMHTQPETAIILGTGLGSLATEITEKYEIKYEEIPNFPVSTVEGHSGKLIFGKLGKKDVMAMQGRFHYYEGFSMKEVTYPVYVMKLLGVKTLVVTNACGGIDRSLVPGDLMLLTDHINMLGTNSLIGPNDERFGVRFPDMTEAYSLRLRELAKRWPPKLDIPCKEGVYAIFSGPCYETAAEIRAYRALGADAIGMSTVPESIAANYLGLEVLGIACITNMATGIAERKHSHEEVLAVADRASSHLCRLVERVIEKL